MIKSSINLGERKLTLSISNKIRNEILEFKILLRSIPATVVTLFVVSVITMNLIIGEVRKSAVMCWHCYIW